MIEPYAKIIADSITTDGHRLTTMECRFHRWILAEVNTHRALSKSSASSRAIPAVKQIAKVQIDPAIPVSFPAEQAGMSGGEELSGMERDIVENTWREAARSATGYAARLVQHGVHKSVTSRMLEPYLMHTAVMTGTAWQNMFGLRCNPLAQPEFRVAAEMMRDAYDSSEPQKVEAGQWHLPYVEEEDLQAIRDSIDTNTVDFEHVAATVAAQVSTARVARTSYLTQDGRRDFHEDLRLYERLVSADPIHAVPLEAVATPAPWNVHEVEVASVSGRRVLRTSGGLNVETPIMTLTLPLYGNLLGWHSLRFDVEVAKQYQAFS